MNFQYRLLHLKHVGEPKNTVIIMGHNFWYLLDTLKKNGTKLVFYGL